MKRALVVLLWPFRWLRRKYWEAIEAEAREIERMYRPREKRRIILPALVALVLLPTLAWAQKPTVIISGDGAATVVSVGTQGPPGASATTIGLVKNVKLYGALGNGTTDDSTAVIAAIQAAYDAGGGIVYFPQGTYRIDSQLAIPQSGNLTKSIRLTGDGGWYNGLSVNANGPSQLDLRYAAGPKIYTIGAGVLEIDHLTLKDTTDGTQAFIFTSFTTVMIHDNAFYGKTPNTPTQDAIVLGDRTPGPLTEQYKFHGYGTVITANYFQNIRRAAYLQKMANAVIVTNNTIWLNCGGDATAAAFEIDGVDSGNDGVTFTGNLVEMVNYVYGIKLTYGASRGTYNNNFFDPGGGGVSFYYLSANSTDNTIIAGDGYSIPLVSGPGATLSNVLDTSASRFRIHNGLEMMGSSIYVPQGQVVFMNNPTNTAGIHADSGGNLIFRAGGADPVNVHSNLFVVTHGITSNIQGPVIMDGNAASYRRIQLGGFGTGGPNFADLAAWVNGTIAYCADCTIANPCAAGGTGALAKRLNGVWVCN